MSDTAICPCEGFTHPKALSFLPNLDAFDYRIGDYLSFRHALLLSLPEEQALSGWRPGATGDLAVQMAEWFAYLADVLTFYNSRVANNDYLRTADQPESVRGLIRILGYRPRPGLGSSGYLAATVTGTRSITIPKGFQVQSKAEPALPPQTFETLADATVAPPTDFQAISADQTALFAPDGSIRLKGASTIKQGDQLLLAARSPAGGGVDYSFVTVNSNLPDTDVLGNPLTKITFDSPPNWPSAKAADYRLLRSRQFLSVWHFGDAVPADPNLESGQTSCHLVSLARTIQPGDLVLFKVGTGPSIQITTVSATQEVTWYLNDPTDPTKAPTGANVVPLIIRHTDLTLSSSVNASWNVYAGMQFDWTEAGTLAPVPVSSIDSTTATLTALSGNFPALDDALVMLEDPNSDGATATAFVGSNPAPTMQLSNLPDPAISLNLPLTVHTALLAITRGKTVANEVLGTGDATLPNQDFTLQKSPVTYLAGDSISGDGYKSTVQVWVDGVQWQEVPSLYAQPAGAKVFITWEDDSQSTHVKFGSPLPTGSGVTATYRIESGAATPLPGDISIIANPIPNLKKVTSTAPLVPGSDPDPASQIRRYAPQSVLTFGRAISGDDYETIAALANGVTRARSYWSWNPSTQRSGVTIYVGDGEAAVESAQAAISIACDPNRPVIVQQATEVPFFLFFVLLVDPKYKTDDVVANVRIALTDSAGGLFGDYQVQIGQVFFDSEIDKAVLGVAGAVALHSLIFYTEAGLATTMRHDPGEGNYFRLYPELLWIYPEVSTDAA